MKVDKLDINKLVKVSTSSNNLKTKVDDLDVGELKIKTVPIDFKKLSHAVKNEVVKNTKFNKLKTKINKLHKKIPDVTTVIHINQYSTEKQNFEKNIRDVYKKMPDVSGLVTTTVSEVKNKLKKQRH